MGPGRREQVVTADVCPIIRLSMWGARLLPVRGISERPQGPTTKAKGGDHRDVNAFFPGEPHGRGLHGSAFFSVNDQTRACQEGN